jgi:hypothetical protein
MESLVHPTTIQVGFHYMFGYNHPYDIHDGTVYLVNHQSAVGSQMKSKEQESILRIG